MMSKKIYFVRHGETILNVKKIRQGEDGELSANGKSQAYTVGERLKPYHIKKIFCSPFQRAVETSAEIMKNINAPIEYTPLLGERRNPSKIIGLSYEDPEAKEAISFMDKSFHPADARWDDEENFLDMKDRALKLKDFLQQNISSSNICITHGVFLKMFLCVLIHGKDLTIERYIKMSVFNPADNAGITVVEYYPLKFFSNPWEIVAYNDAPLVLAAIHI
jgi:broad specificity phosphatase PhoE